MAGDWYDKSQEGNQRKERDRLIAGGMNPKKASRLAKQKFPLPLSRARKKNNQPKTTEGGGDRLGHLSFSQTEPTHKGFH